MSNVTNKSDWAKAIDEYNASKKTKKDLDKLNKKLVALGEKPLLDLDEAAALAKKNAEDAAECIPGTGTSAHPDAILDANGVDVRPRPEFASSAREQVALKKTWLVIYDTKGNVSGVYEKK